MDSTSWLIFFAGLVNQAGRVMIPAVKTSVMADAAFGVTFKQNVGAMLSGVSIVCLGGKMVSSWPRLRPSPLARALGGAMAGRPLRAIPVCEHRP